MKLIRTNNYSIEIGALQDSSFETFVRSNYHDARIVIIVDENTHEYCLEFLITSFDFLADAEVMLLPAGEENKVLEVCFQVWEAMSDYGIGRKDLVINLGGGVVTDMGGFIASVYKRGVDYINIPTTLLGMVDAAIGGKTGIDLGALKNQLGVFNNPKAVFVDRQFLSTLEGKELANGFAEMMKHALIRDKQLWARFAVVEDLADVLTDELISTTIEIKTTIVNEDPKEQGLRKILNFGHTAGHAIEGYFLDKDRIDHGHAVALGMIVETYLSWKQGFITKENFESIERVILDWFPLHTMDSNDIPGMIELLYNDKKNHSGKIQCCLLRSVGECVYDQVIEEVDFFESFLYLVNRSVNLN